jgi:hypothetical protein
MNTEKKIEQSLRTAPKPPAPDSLLNKLQENIDLAKGKESNNIIRRCFAPAGHLSIWRIAAGFAIAVLVLLPLSYGANKVMKYFDVFEAEFDYPEDNTVIKVKEVMASSNPNATEEDMNRINEEFYRLYKEGKTEEIKPGLWSAVLSNGERFNYGGDPELLGLSEEEKKEVLQKQFDEIHELRKAGKFEKTYMPEHDYEIEGVKYRYFQARYVLSDGTVKTMGDSEPVIAENQDNY